MSFPVKNFVVRQGPGVSSAEYGVISGRFRGVARGAVAPPSCHLRKYKIMNVYIDMKTQ